MLCFWFINPHAVQVINGRSCVSFVSEVTHYLYTSITLQNEHVHISDVISTKSSLTCMVLHQSYVVVSTVEIIPANWNKKVRHCQAKTNRARNKGTTTSKLQNCSLGLGGNRKWTPRENLSLQITVTFAAVFCCFTLRTVQLFAQFTQVVCNDTVCRYLILVPLPGELNYHFRCGKVWESSISGSTSLVAKSFFRLQSSHEGNETLKYRKKTHNSCSEKPIWTTRSLDRHMFPSASTSIWIKYHGSPIRIYLKIILVWDCRLQWQIKFELRHLYCRPTMWHPIPHPAYRGSTHCCSQNKHHTPNWEYSLKTGELPLTMFFYYCSWNQACCNVEVEAIWGSWQVHSKGWRWLHLRKNKSCQTTNSWLFCDCVWHGY